MLDRRCSPRRSVSEAAKIIFNYRHVRECTVRDISDHGACLHLTSSDIPDTFDLVRDQSAHTCQVRWRGPHQLGVVFDPFFVALRQCSDSL